jgi:ATP-binding protein involved in chromosome partitioning
MPAESEVLHALKQVQDPDLHRDIVSLGFVRHLTVDGGRVGFTIELTTPACPVKDQLKAEAERVVAALPDVTHVAVAMDAKVPEPMRAGGAILPNVRHVIPIAAGKGGVGKSTVSANLAVALAKSGANVGLLDLDIYGPSIPGIMGVTDPPRVEKDKLIPPIAHGVKVISMAFFTKADEATIWRGPMLHKVVEQFLTQVEWGDLDYLLADFPPGTGDVQLSLCQIMPLTGAVIVCTPQEAALQVARRAVVMFERLRTPVLGVVENMSYYQCPHCEHHEHLFGHGGAKHAAEAWGVPLIGEIPLAKPVREAGDAGAPVTAVAPETPLAKAFFVAARNLAARVSVRALAGSQPDIKVSF